MTSDRPIGETPTARFAVLDGNVCLVGRDVWDTVAFRVVREGAQRVFLAGFVRAGHSSFVFDYYAVPSPTRPGYMTVVERRPQVALIRHICSGALRNYVALAAAAFPCVVALLAPDEAELRSSDAMLLGILFGGAAWGLASILRWIVDFAVSHQVEMIEQTPFPDEYARSSGLP
jgi:hypothetical protein